MGIRIYDALNQQKKELVPLEGKSIKMYGCGITVNGDCHIGHARQAITYDIINQYLRYRGYKVTYARNYTDIDDKIIQQASAQGITPFELADIRIKETDEVLKPLLMQDADIKPRVTENIQEIIDFINGLILKGYAYATPMGDVYYSVKKFKDYGKLSNRNTDELINGVRIEVEEGKNDPLDFALWKSAKENEVYWETPWGNGRPGWHIECSAMIKRYFGETIDIHGGGKDLMFPHHENEIAQSEALNDKPLANYWTYNGLVTVDGKKMGKSAGNFITTKSMIDIYNPEVIRYSMIRNHYSSPIDMGELSMNLSEKQLYYFYNTLDSIDNYVTKFNIDEKSILKEQSESQFHKEFIKAMDDDFNTSIVVANLFVEFKNLNKLMNNKDEDTCIQLVQKKKDITRVVSTIGLLQQDPKTIIKEIKNKYLNEKGLLEKEILNLVDERKIAKLNKNYELSDSIRRKLDVMGIILRDSKEETYWDIKDLYNEIDRSDEVPKL